LLAQLSKKYFTRRATARIPRPCSRRPGGWPAAAGDCPGPAARGARMTGVGTPVSAPLGWPNFRAGPEHDAAGLREGPKPQQVEVVAVLPACEGSGRMIFSQHVWPAGDGKHRLRANAATRTGRVFTPTALHPPAQPLIAPAIYPGSGRPTSEYAESVTQESREGLCNAVGVSDPCVCLPRVAAGAATLGCGM
jgi:hypothetical protein